MLLVTEFDPSLKVKDTLPPSVVKTIYLTAGLNPKLNMQASFFGPPVFFIHLGYNVRAAEYFVRDIPKEANVILISPLSKWGIYQIKLGSISGLVRSDQFDTRESKVELVMELTGLSKNKAATALDLLKYNFSLIEKNLDLLRWCASTRSDVESALNSVEYFSYTDVLFYLCGSDKHPRDKFIKTLAKYRYANKHMLKYLRKVISEFVEFKLTGEKPSDKNAYTIQRLESVIYLEDALVLQIFLEQSHSLIDLLSGTAAH